MRSRFWMGGPHIGVRNVAGIASRAVRPIASRVLGNPETNARNLMVHCGPGDESFGRLLAGALQGVPF